MDTPIYQYMHFEDYIDISDVGKLTHPQQAGNLTLALGRAGERITQFAMDHEGGRFEVISHSLVRIGDVLVVSYLLRRIAGVQNMP